jgi:hypothetical protein
MPNNIDKSQKETSPILRNNIDIIPVNLQNKNTLKFMNLSHQDLKQLASDLIGEHNHLTKSQLLISIKQQTSSANENQILEQMMNHKIIMYAVPFDDRYCLSGSTPF